MNQHEDKKVGTHICIEPFRQNEIRSDPKPDVIPKLVQNVPLSRYQMLDEGDILFIDSSHVAQPYGDTIWELVCILPSLKKGVLVHIHDIFLPHDYPRAFSLTRHYTEQWFLTAFLYGNTNWEILWSDSYFPQFYEDKYSQWNVSTSWNAAGGIWIQKVK